MKGTGYSLLSPVYPSLPLPRVTMCHHISTGVYKYNELRQKKKEGGVGGKFELKFACCCQEELENG